MRKYHWCDKHVNIGDLLEYSKCSGIYHYFYVNIEKSTFLSEKHELERTWTCTVCQIITQLKNGEDNTPKRPKTQNQQHLNDTITLIDINSHLFEESILGDTQQKFYSTGQENY